MLYIFAQHGVPRWVYVRLLDIVLMLKELIRGMPSVKMRSCNRGRRVYPTAEALQAAVNLFVMDKDTEAVQGN